MAKNPRQNFPCEDVTVTKINHDQSGNPRYVVHFISLDVKPEEYRNNSIPNLTKYRAKWYSGGYVFQSYNVSDDIKWMKEQVKNYYNRLCDSKPH